MRGRKIQLGMQWVMRKDIFHWICLPVYVDCNTIKMWKKQELQKHMLRHFSTQCVAELEEGLQILSVYSSHDCEKVASFSYSCFYTQTSLKCCGVVFTKVANRPISPILLVLSLPFRALRSHSWGWSFPTGRALSLGCQPRLLFNLLVFCECLSYVSNLADKVSWCLKMLRAPLLAHNLKNCW